MTFPYQINNDLFYRDPEGREGFVIFNSVTKLAYFVPHIGSSDGHGFPPGFSAETLRQLADRLDAQSGEAGS